MSNPFFCRIGAEERKLVLAQRKLESIRVLDELISRAKVKIRSTRDTRESSGGWPVNKWHMAGHVTLFHGQKLIWSLGLISLECIYAHADAALVTRLGKFWSHHRG